jgi:steroid 5-alpha reductase family enzyme
MAVDVPTMADDDISLHWLVLPEVVALFVLWVVILSGLLGVSTAFTSYPLSLRLAGLAFLTLEWAIPLGVYLDLRRRDDDPDRMWVHAAALPVVNLLGVIAYLEDRRRSRGE